MNWLVRLFGRKEREPAPEAVQARELVRRIEEQADFINGQLKSYQRSRDPFAAMMADMYNRDQLNRIHRGTNS
jgi:hypothetical protein